MDYYKKTLDYYSQWLDLDISKQKKNDTVFVKSDKRNVKQAGYSQNIKGYIYQSNNTILFSYGDELEPLIPQIRQHLKPNNIVEILNNIGIKNLTIDNKYYFNNDQIPSSNTEAVALSLKDKDDFYSFFREVNVITDDAEWIYDYFTENLEKNSLWAIYKNNKIVACTEAPFVPYMNDKIVDIGINTLKDYQKQGLAKKVATNFTNSIIKDNKVPIWACSGSNVASIKLAESIGFVKLAEVIMVY